MNVRYRTSTIRPGFHLQEMYFAQQKALNAFQVEFLCGEEEGVESPPKN